MREPREPRPDENGGHGEVRAVVTCAPAMAVAALPTGAWPLRRACPAWRGGVIPNLELTPAGSGPEKIPRPGAPPGRGGASVCEQGLGGDGALGAFTEPSPGFCAGAFWREPGLWLPPAPRACEGQRSRGTGGTEPLQELSLPAGETQGPSPQHPVHQSRGPFPAQTQTRG